MQNHAFLEICQKLWSNEIWKSGFLSGVTVSSCIGIILACYPYWNSQLSVILNIINILDIRCSLIFTKLTHLKQTNIDAINFHRKMQLFLPVGPVRAVKSIKTENIASIHGHTIPIHIITPNNHIKNNPIIIYYHGGGFVIGCVNFYKSALTSLAQYTGCVVIGIDYRKAPEHKFPAGPQDCLEVTRWIIQNGQKYDSNPKKICIMGDSAGGNIATIVARELSSSISLSIPIYPVIYFGQLSHSKFLHRHQPVLPQSVMDWFNLCYFNSREEMTSRYANPYYGDLTKLPRTHVVTAEFDVLRDEGIEYYQTLKEIGINVTHQHYNNTVHGFYGAEYLITHGKQSVIDTAKVIKEHFQL